MFANRDKVNYNKKREVYMSKLKSYIMDVEDFVNGYFDYETETFKISKEQILTAVKNEFKDNMSQNKAINLGLKGLLSVPTEEDDVENEGNENIEIAVINTSEGFHTLDSKSVGEAVKKIK